MEPKKILIIEDEEVLLAALTKKLENSGYRVEGASDGKIGLDLVRKKNPDLILLDILLPKMDGFEILADLKKDLDLKAIPVIIISNSGQPVDIERASKLGAVDYLIKAEFDPEEVLEKIEKVLGPRPKEKVSINPASAPDLELKEGRVKGPRILVVEDDKFLRNIIVQKLNTEGFTVEEAVDGEEAFKKIKKDPPKLILLDLLLPAVDGFEVLRKMQEDKELVKIPVLVLSNLGQDEDIKRAKELGAKDYMVKAYFTPTEIIAKVQKILRESYF